MLADLQQREPVQRHPALGQQNRRRQRIAPGKAAQFLQNCRHAGDLTGYRDCCCTAKIALFLDSRPAKEISIRTRRQRIIGWIQRSRRKHAEIPRAHPAAGPVAIEHQTAAADTAHPGFDDAQRQGRDHGRIDGITARGEHRRPRQRRQTALRGHDAACRHHGRLGQGLMAREAIHHDDCGPPAAEPDTSRGATINAVGDGRVKLEVLAGQGIAAAGAAAEAARPHAEQSRLHPAQFLRAAYLLDFCHGIARIASPAGRPIRKGRVGKRGPSCGFCLPLGLQLLPAIEQARLKALQVCCRQRPIFHKRRLRQKRPERNEFGPRGAETLLCPSDPGPALSHTRLFLRPGPRYIFGYITLCGDKMRLPLILLLALLYLLPLRPAAAQTLVAAASDLQFALEELAARFTEESGRPLRLVFGSSGNLARQIEKGAPFEVFLSADESYVERLEQAGKTRDSGVIYALGRLALVLPATSPLEPDASLEGLKADLRAGRVTRFAIANPDHAPYGRAAREALEAA